MPFTPGSEAAGVVEAVGPGVTEVKPGDRVAYVGGPSGSYSEARVMPAGFLVKLPDSIDEVTAAAAILKGMTAHALIFSTYAVKPGDTILVQAAAGGVGLILCQWAKHLGATVIGTVGNDAKARIAATHGCDHTIVYTREDFPARLKELTDGAMVPVVYDSVGQATFMKSLDCLRPRGLMVSFGQASGVVPPFSVNLLGAKGVALPHASDAPGLHRQSRGSGRSRQRTLRGAGERRRQMCCAAAVPVARRCRGPSRAGRA